MAAGDNSPEPLYARVPEPRTAKASDHPCELYLYHSPRPSRTQYHHRHPVYLQNEVYGRIVDASDEHMMWLCGTCHDSVHDWISWLLRRARKPDPEPGWKTKAEAERAVQWYASMLRAMGV